MLKYTKDKIEKHLLKVLRNSNVLYYKNINNLHRKNINFIVIPKLKNNMPDNLSNFQFLLSCSDKTAMSIICPMVYKTKDKDSLLYTLNAINTVNSKMAIGKLFLNQNPDLIVSYFNRILFNDITTELTSKLFNAYIDSFLLYSLDFYKQMKDKTNE